MRVEDLHDDPDCPDCKNRARYVYSIHCRRCVARMLAREPPSVAAYRGEKMRSSLSREDHDDMLRLVAEEREADRRG